MEMNTTETEEGYTRAPLSPGYTFNDEPSSTHAPTHPPTHVTVSTAPTEQAREVGELAPLPHYVSIEE